MTITKANFRDQLYAAIAEWEFYKGNFHLVTFMVNHPEVNSIGSLIEAITNEAIEGLHKSQEVKG